MSLRAEVQFGREICGELEIAEVTRVVGHERIGRIR